MKGQKVSFTIPEWLVDAIDEIADDIQGTRSDVVSELLIYCFDDEDVLDEVFPLEETPSAPGKTK